MRLTKSSHGVEETSGKSSKTAIAKTSILLELLQVLEVETELIQGLVDLALNAQIDHSVGERAAHVVLEREVVDALGVLVVVVLLCADPARDQMVANRVREREVVVARCRYVTVLHEREVKVTVERLLHCRYVLDQSDAAHTDLLALLFVVLGYRVRHWDAVLS